MLAHMHETGLLEGLCVIAFTPEGKVTQAELVLRKDRTRLRDALRQGALKMDLEELNRATAGLPSPAALKPKPAAPVASLSTPLPDNRGHVRQSGLWTPKAT